MCPLLLAHRNGAAARVQSDPGLSAAHGHFEFVARGGHAENLEGDWEPGRIVILEFESLERAREWWASEEYREPKAMRQSASTGKMIVVEGV